MVGTEFVRSSFIPCHLQGKTAGMGGGVGVMGEERGNKIILYCPVKRKFASKDTVYVTRKINKILNKRMLIPSTTYTLHARHILKKNQNKSKEVFKEISIMT